MFADPFQRQVLLHQYVEPAVNRQPSFCRELVEQISSSDIDSYVGTGSKPSTWFPPGTRRADHLFL